VALSELMWLMLCGEPLPVAFNTATKQWAVVSTSTKYEPQPLYFGCSLLCPLHHSLIHSLVFFFACAVLCCAVCCQTGEM
jgi:hypothetical protein